MPKIDHAVFAESLAVVLADAGYRVTGVTYHPDAAVAALTEAEPELCLIDLTFPGGTVMDRMAELRAVAPGTRFVVLTGFLDRQVVEAGIRAGVRGFAHKGQQVRDIVRLLDRVLRGERVVEGGDRLTARPLAGVTLTQRRVGHPEQPVEVGVDPVGQHQSISS